MSELKHVCTLLRDEERLVDILAKLRRGDLSGDQVQLRYEFVDLSMDPDLFPYLKDPLKSKAFSTLDWVREDVATLNKFDPGRA